jgi:hypothetical protein
MGARVSRVRKMNAISGWRGLGTNFRSTWKPDMSGSVNSEITQSTCGDSQIASPAAPFEASRTRQSGEEVLSRCTQYCRLSSW